eukprot:gb/GECG01005718.1/.p1 GENE.gb/GECG01005718.1/~~gb/GECG01005718.1/.p1  ORF type:complete len:1094 (+),score=200.14 gb/GECG01005718.1/:1-3282(+)
MDAFDVFNEEEEVDEEEEEKLLAQYNRQTRQPNDDDKPVQETEKEDEPSKGAKQIWEQAQEEEEQQQTPSSAANTRINKKTSRDEEDNEDNGETQNGAKRPKVEGEQVTLLSQLDEAGSQVGEASKEAIHDVARPEEETQDSGEQGGAKPDELDDSLPSKMAKEYKFDLDPFQRRSIACLERSESVLVAAHTSAGKTVVAEYAIAMALRDKQRVIYTSPIKALSNQKYRDLYEEFSDVGLMTGDVSISPNASCLVMTTEILRSMLYRGSEITREVKWVIFDEVHYMRDKERGVVWEESIIMLPPQVRFVFLSATIPNAKQFAEWIASVKHQPCHVVYTDYRPTPLQHYVFPSGGDGVYLVVDEKGRFREDNFSKAMAQLEEEEMGEDSGGKGNKKKGKQQKSQSKGKSGQTDLYRLLKMIMERNYDPVIVFSFSKRECESYALQISRLDFTTDDEKQLIETVFNNAIDGLSEDDKKLPQIHAILPLLKKGVGIHHGGLLPILKEITEILFQESLIKVLFATETFAMGVNMPAKTVVFTACRKFDGSSFRLVSAGEYIQMSGRAGRRGIDDRGIVIQIVDEKMEPSSAKQLMKGTPDPLNSSFHLGYNMLLNLLRVEDVDPEKVMEQSLHQFQNRQAAPEMKRELQKLEKQMEDIQIDDEKEVSEYYEMTCQMAKLRAAMRQYINQPAYSLPFLQPGRLVRVRDKEEDWGWGVIVNYQRNKNTEGKKNENDPKSVVLDCLLLCDPVKEGSAGSIQRREKPKPCPPELAAQGRGELRVVPVLLSLLDGFSQLRVYLPKDLRPSEARQEVARRVSEIKKRYPNSLPLLDPINDMRIEDDKFKKLVKKIGSLQDKITKSYVQSLSKDDRNKRYQQYEEKQSLQSQIQYLKEAIKGTETLVMKDTLRRMKRVLRRLKHIDDDNIVQMKGKTACEINTADELLVTELIFNGVFNDLTPAQTAALLSCLVYTERNNDDPPQLPHHLAEPFRKLQEAARRIATVSKEAKLDIDIEEYVNSFKPDIMELVYAWVMGSKFADICQMTKVFEGSIVRVMRRLEELLRQLSDAARSIGDTKLQEKFADSSEKMRRDIIFAASLYL